MPSPERQSDSVNKRPRRTIQSTEIVGALLIAVLLLLFTVVRYWHYIQWNLR